MDLLFSSLSLKRFSYLAFVAFVVYLIQADSNHSEIYWLISSAFLLSLITTGDSFKRRLTAIVITGLSAGFITVFVGSLTSSPMLVTLILFLITIFCVAISEF